jgi:dienelactone hydrolase
MSCCPPNSEPHLATDYNPKGKTGIYDGVEFYSVGSLTSKCGILIIPDVFGWNGSRTRNVADHFADLDGVRGSGYYVVVPKILTPAFEGGHDGDGLPADFDLATRGDVLGPFIKSFPWDLLSPRLNAALKHMINEGITKIALVGFCWGGWAASHILAEDSMPTQVVCAAIPHPSILCEEMHGGNAVDLVSRSKGPVLLLPAGNDSDRYRPGGDILEALRAVHPDSDAALDFGEMRHGWAVRGDVAVPAVRAAVDLALDKSLRFIAAQFAKRA